MRPFLALRYFISGIKLDAEGEDAMAKLSFALFRNYLRFKPKSVIDIINSHIENNPDLGERICSISQKLQGDNEDDKETRHLPDS
jgi:hypothetical protein